MKQNADFFAVVTAALAKAAFCLAAACILLSLQPAAAAEDEVTAQWWYGARLSVAPGSVSENGGKQLVIVTAEVSEWGTSTSDLSYEVTVGKGGDSAVSGTDYKAVSKFNIIIKSGRRSGSNSFHLEPIGDTDWEGDETITIHASGTGGAQSTALTLTDEGDRPYSGPPITLSANPSKVSEADGATTVTVTATLPSAAAADVQATLSVGGGTATPGTDYAAVPDFTITVAKNATSATGTFTLTPTQDTLVEGDETITITGPAGVSTPATLTLTDDDVAPAVTLSVSPSSVTENGGAQTVTVTATSASAATKARTLLVAVGNRQDSATPGTDYTVVPAFNITIAANATTATGSFRLTPTNDTSVEDAESISIDGTPESGGVNFTVSSATLTLTDDDAQPAVTLTATPSSVDEAALATSVTVKATAASAVAWARTVTVSVGKTGSAASGTDYAAVSNFDIAIAANGLSGTGTFTLKPIQDTTNEGNETIGVAGTSLNTTVTGTTVTIADDDINPAITLSVSPSSVSESASATSVTVTATAASAMSSARTVSVKVGNTGTATSGTDYAAVSDFTITIAANATSGTGTFTLTPTQDTVIEGGETIGVSGASTGTTVTGTTVALTDDDSLPAVTLSVSSSSVSESASATAVTVTATATGATAAARTVTVSVGQTGSAASGSDYAAVTDFDITIASMATSGTGSFTLTPIQDSLVEHNETIGVDGSSPNTTMTNATITLTDDDKDSVTLSLNRRTLGEEASGTSVTVTATAATAIAAARTVTVSVGDTGTATSGTDYSAVSDFTITIAANATSGTGSFTLTPTQDTTNEGNETIGIAGTNSLSTVTGTTLTLVDDDQPTISLAAGTAAFSESWSGTINVTATRSGSTTSAVDVTIIVGRDTDSATEGVDYTEVADYTITIPAGQTSASKGFSVSGKRDYVADNNERFSVGGLATGYKVNDVSNGVGIFEWYATIGLTTDVSSVSEYDGATTVTVTAHIHPTVYGNVYVTVSVGGGTATSGTDYAAVSNFTITIPNKASSATGTFTLTPTQDALLESDETININGSGSHFNFYAGQGTSMTLTDAQPISLSATPSSVSEGAPPTHVAVTATATGTVSTPRTLTVSVGDTGTATSGTDYAAVSDFDITIPANKTGATNTFTLTPTKDSAGEGDETIGVSGSSTGAYVYPTTLTLADTNPAVTLSAAPSSISEGAGATAVTVTATASETLATARTVTVSVGDSGTATSGTDYAAVSDFTITIAANETSGTGTFTLTPTDDTALEGDETIGVTGTSAEAAAISHTVLTLTDDDLPTIALTTVPSYVAVAEDGGRKSVTVRATAAAAMKAATTVTLAIGASGDSATKTTDYTTSNVRTITIPKGQSTAEASFELTPVQDTLVEGNESVSVSGSSSGGHTVTGTSLTLTDDDKHAIALSASPASVAESASGTSVTVTATAKSSTSSARTVKVKVGGSGTATSGTDYAAVSDFNVTIAANAKTGTGTFTLTPTQDTTVEGNETIGVAGTSTNSTVAGTTVTLTDDDSYPAITLSANPASVSEGASATSVTVTATAASAIASARTVTVSVGGTGTATRGTDYATVADFTVTIAANATSGTGTFTLTPTQDTAVEGSETIGVAGASASSTVTATTVTLTDDDTHAITLSASPSSVSESKANETITVTATINVARASATDVTVSVGESTDQATSGTDYEAVSDFTVTIAANKTSGASTFTFKPKTDSAYEGFETVTISGTTSQPANAGGASASASIPVTATSLSIHDASNYPAVSLSAAPSSVSESAGATSVTVTATAASAIASSREVTVSVGGSGAATSGTDYAAVSDFIVKIAANATTGTGTFTLTPTQDTVFEGSETIGVAGTSLGTTVTGTTLTLTDDDSATVTINDASADEGDSMTFTVTLDKAVQGGLTVTPGYTNGTTADADYTRNTTALSFTGTANETKTFTVSTTEDAVLEANETFTVGLTVSNAPSGVTATDTGTGTINNDDSAAVTINDANADEGNDITFTVTLDQAVQSGLTVTPGFTDVTAVEGTDYDENTSALSFTGTASETKTFTVSTTDDDVLEHAETLTVGLSVSGTTLSVTATDTGTGTVNNDDSAAVTINDASADEGDDITFTVTLSDAVQGGLTVTPGFTDVTAVEGTDYDENTTALSFTGTANETQTFTVSTTDDDVLEHIETFTVGLSVSNAPSGVTATDTGTGAINDSGDNADQATLTINDASADEGDSMTFTVTLDEAVQGGLTVTPSYTNGTAASGDYTANTTALTFTGTANETKTFTVSTIEDAVLEDDETFTVGLSVSNAPNGVTSSDTGTGTINNDDSAAVTINDASADEGDSMTFTVTLDQAVQGGLTVTPGFTDGTAVEGTDYDENTSALSFTGTANETKTFTVSTTEDAVLEGDETFTVGLTVSGTSLSVTATDTGTGTVNNDDGATVTINDASASEGESMTFTVSLGAAVAGGLTVTPGYTNGTAGSGDYTANTTALSFTGTTNENKTFTVSTTEDTDVEGNETFTVGLTVSGTTLSVTATDTGTGTINDDDSAAVTINDASASEGDAMTFTVTLNKAVPGGLTVTPGFTDVDAVEGTDYTENTAALSFTGTANETKTFTVSTTEDTVLELSETFTVGLSVSDTTHSVTASDTGTGTINDDESNPYLGLDSPSVAEGDSGATTLTFTAKLTDKNGKTKSSPREITANYQVLSEPGDTATAGEDYTAKSGKLTFAPGETSKTIDVEVLGDNVTEGDETLTLKWVNPWSNVLLVSYTATGTITDDDLPPPLNTPTPTVSLSLDPSSISENGGLSTVTATLSAAAPSGGITVAVSAAPVAPATAEDFTLSGTTLTIATGATTSTTVTITAKDNEAENNARQVTVSGTSAQANDPAPVILTITDDDGAPATPWQTEPSKPLYLKATANGQNQIDLEWWTPMSDGGARISGYRVFVSEDGGERWDILVPDTGTDATTYAHTGLRWGTTRHYQVAAINKVGLSQRSNVAWATTETPTAPWKPNALRAVAVGQSQIDLDWVVPLDGGSPITGYRVEVSADAGVSWVVLEADTGNTETNYSHLGLEPESTRHYRVAAINEMGPGAWSKVAWATTDPALTPGAVVDLSALAEGQTMIHLDWHAPEDDGGRPVRGYRIEVSQDTGSRWEDLESDTGTTDTTYAHAGLEPDSTRHYRVSAINEAGVGDKSNEASATTDPARVATRVLDLAAIADGQTLIHLDWREPAEDGGAAITGYRIEVSLDAGIVWTDLESDTGTTETNYAHTGLEPATTGYYRVSAINEVGLSDPSNEANATTDPARVAARVIDLVAVADGQDVINLHWSEPEEDGGASITGYRIEVSADAGSRWSDLESDTGTTDTTYAHAGLRPDSTRYYRVSAWNEAGLSDPSNEAFATTVGKDAYNLAAFGRTVATSAVGVIGGRLNEAEPDTPSYLVLGGQTIRLGNTRRDRRERQPRAEADNEWMPPAWTPPARAEAGEGLTPTACAPAGPAVAGEALTPAADALPVHAAASDELAVTAGAVPARAEAGEALTPAACAAAGPVVPGESLPPVVGAVPGPAVAGEPLMSMAGAPVASLQDVVTTTLHDGSVGGHAQGSPVPGSPLPGALASVSQWADNADSWNVSGSHYRLVPSGLERRPVGAMPSLREFLAASSLELHLGPGGARAGAGDPVSWTLWYDGELSRFSGQLAGGAQQGEVFSAYLGLDYHGFDNMTAGVALTHSTGEMDFDAGDLGYRNVDAKVTSLMPYLRWSPRARWNLWALSGYGSGRMDVQESDNIEHRADLALYLGAMGVRRELVRFDIGAELAVKADAFGVRVETEETDYLAGTTGDAGRVRLLLEGSGDWLLDDEQSVRPSVSIGARWDAGDAETGLGAELNAELGYDNVRLGLSLDVRGRVLLAHADEAYEEWGIGLGLQVDPGQLGVGWSFSVAPTWGSVAGEASGLWQGEQSLQDYAGVGPQRVGAGWRPDSTELRVQHGALGRRGVVTTFGEMHLAGAGYHDTRLGFRFEGGGGLGGRDWSDGMRYELRLEQQARPHEAADYGLFLDVSGRF